MSGDWLHYIIYYIFVIIWQLFFTMQLAAASEIKGTQNQIKEEVHVHHLNMYMCDQEHTRLTGSLIGLKYVLCMA